MASWPVSAADPLIVGQDRGSAHMTSASAGGPHLQPVRRQTCSCISWSYINQCAGRRRKNKGYTGLCLHPGAGSALLRLVKMSATATGVSRGTVLLLLSLLLLLLCLLFSWVTHGNGMCTWSMSDDDSANSTCCSRSKCGNSRTLLLLKTPRYYV